MKTAIVYHSYHHGNTKKLVDAIAAKHEVTLVDVLQKNEFDLTGFDVIGFASGIYAFGISKEIVTFAGLNLLVQSKISDAKQAADNAIFRVDNILARLRAEQING